MRVRLWSVKVTIGILLKYAQLTLGCFINKELTSLTDVTQPLDIEVRHKPAGLP